ncbi:hypothetical protein ColTof3_14613 [Colletotrichum tofieldiae]|nr:hypothetical protein ColTof3_14613 [Colletotrichum tofieldiae]
MTPVDTDSISELYQSYKASTNSFLTWLWCQYHLESPQAAKGHKFQSTSDILKAAKVLQQVKSAVPSSVIGILRDAIMKRKHVFSVYQKLGAADHGHEAFVVRLEETLSILIPLAEEGQVWSTDESKCDRLTMSNLFTYLPVVDDDTETHAAPACTDHKHHGSPPPSPLGENNPANTSVPSSFRLEDDWLREVFDAAYFLIELHTMRSLVKKYWQDAAQGHIPLCFAAWLTNFAFYNTAKVMPPRFAEVCINIFAQPEFVRNLFTKALDVAEPEVYISDGTRLFILAETINNFGATLPEFPKPKISGKTFRCDNPECACKFKTGNLPKAVDDDKGESLSQHEKDQVKPIFDNVRKDFETERAIAVVEDMKPLKCGCFTPICEPFFFVARDFLSQRVPLASARLVSALDLFFLAEDAFQASDADLIRSQCRLQALRLAMEIRASISPVMEVIKTMVQDCERARYWYNTLQSFHQALGAYLRERKFDIYHTSPWTAGSHMMEMLTQAFCCGYRVNSDWATISATLHLYNAMRHSVADTPSIPVFDELCQLFIEKVFRGSLPNRNFCSTYRRIVYHSKIKKGSVSQSKRSAFSLAIGFTRVPQDLEIDCWLIDHHFSNHDEDPWFQAAVHDIDKSGSEHKTYRKIKEAQAKVTLSEYMEKSKARILLELKGPRPIARLNFFAVFMLCSKFLEKPWQAWQTTRTR